MKFFIFILILTMFCVYLSSCSQDDKNCKTEKIGHVVEIGTHCFD